MQSIKMESHVSSMSSTGGSDNECIASSLSTTSCSDLQVTISNIDMQTKKLLGYWRKEKKGATQSIFTFTLEDRCYKLSNYHPKTPTSSHWFLYVYCQQAEHFPLNVSLLVLWTQCFCVLFCHLWLWLSPFRCFMLLTDTTKDHAEVNWTLLRRGHNEGSERRQNKIKQIHLF